MTHLLGALLIVVALVGTIAGMSPRTPSTPRHVCVVVWVAACIGLFFVIPWVGAMAAVLVVFFVASAVNVLDRAELRFQDEWRRYVGAQLADQPLPVSPPKSVVVTWALAHNRDAAEAIAGLALSAMAGSCESCGRRPATERIRLDGALMRLCADCHPYGRGRVFAS